MLVILILLPLVGIFMIPTILYGILYSSYGLILGNIKQNISYTNIVLSLYFVGSFVNLYLLIIASDVDLSYYIIGISNMLNSLLWVLPLGLFVLVLYLLIVIWYVFDEYGFKLKLSNSNSIVLHFVIAKLGLFLLFLICGSLPLDVSLASWGLLVGYVGIVYYYKFKVFLTFNDIKQLVLYSLPYTFVLQLGVLFIIFIFYPEFIVSFIGIDNIILSLNNSALVMQDIDKKLWLTGSPAFLTVENFLRLVNYSDLHYKTLFQAYVDSTPSTIMRSPSQMASYMESFPKSYLFQNGQYTRVTWQLIRNGGGFPSKL